MGSSVILPVQNQPPEGPDPNFRSLTVKRAISFATEHLSPPSPLYVTAENKLLINCQNAVPGAGLKISLRILFPDGTINYGETVFAPTSDRTVNTFEIPLQEGFLLSVHVASSGPQTRRGQLWSTVAIEYGTVGFGAFVQRLIADYIVSNTHTGWPGGQIRQNTEGPGLMRSVQNAAPAAGADFAITVPTGARWRLQSIRFSLTTSAAAGTRIAEVTITDGVSNLMRFVPGATQAPSTTASYYLEQGSVFNAIDPGQVMLPFSAPVTLLQGWVIGTGTVALQAGDQYSVQQLSVEEWLEN